MYPQPGGFAWNLYDARLHQLGMTFPDYREAEAAGAVKRDPAFPLLDETLQQIKSEKKDPFGRDFSKLNRLDDLIVTTLKIRSRPPTTWLRNGFESAKSYLGLDRAAAPMPDEERPASVVRCVRAPDPFDYRRVLVALPSDAPPYSGQREAWNVYVRKFLMHLGERTRGRMLVLFTNQEELRRFGEELSGFFRARRIPFWYQGMRGIAKEELAQLFRSRTDSILMGVDTFWYGADFPGETLEYLVIVKLPYGVPDRYHHAQCAALGSGAQRKRIYLPRALAKFRQGFGRLMRRETDRGCVFLLDSRAQQGQHRLFLDELPLAGSLDPEGDAAWSSEGARVIRAPTEECLHAALAHMDMQADVRRRGLDAPFEPRAAPDVARDGLESLDSDEVPF